MNFKKIFLIGSTLLFLSPFLHAEVVDKILVVINDDIVTQSDLVEFKSKLKHNGLIDEALLNMYDKKKLLSDDKALINYLIDEKIIDSEIRAQGIVAPIEQVESEIRNIARSRGIDKSQLKAALKKEGVSYSDYQNFVKTSLQRQTLLQKEVTSKIKISDEETDAYYLAHNTSNVTRDYELVLAHILFLNSNGGVNEAKKRADVVSKKLKQGLPFESLASKYSEDPNFVSGGLFGTFKLSDFKKDVSQYIAPLKAGEVSLPVKMPDGFRIFKVIKKTVVASPELEAKREDIRRVLLSQGFKKQFRLWLDQKRRDSHVHIN